MTPEQVAEHWGCSAQHVRNLIKRGELRTWRLGARMFRVPADAVAEFEAKNTLAPNDEVDAAVEAAREKSRVDWAARLVRLAGEQQARRGRKGA